MTLHGEREGGKEGGKEGGYPLLETKTQINEINITAKQKR
jgi:hypothetical protein